MYEGDIPQLWMGKEMRRFCVVFSSAFPSIKHVWRTPPSPPRLAHGLSTSDHMTLFIHIGGKERCELQANHDYDDDDVMKKNWTISTCPFRNDAKLRVFSLSDNGKPVFIWNFTPFTMLSMEVGSGVVTGHFSTFAHWRNLQEKI